MAGERHGRGMICVNRPLVEWKQGFIRTFVFRKQRVRVVGRIHAANDRRAAA